MIKEYVHVSAGGEEMNENKKNGKKNKKNEWNAVIPWVYLILFALLLDVEMTDEGIFHVHFHSEILGTHDAHASERASA